MKIPNTKFHESPDGGSRGIPSGQTKGRTHITKLIIVSLNYHANASKNAKIETMINHNFIHGN